MTDDDVIEISVTSGQEGADAANIQVRFGNKKATVLLRPGTMLTRMTDADWRQEFGELAAALNKTRII